MGLAVDTEKTFELYLQSDTDIPEDKRPTFIFRFPSHRKYMQTEALVIKTQSETDGLKFFEMAIEAISINLVNWKNINHPFDLKELDNILTPLEIMELCDKLLPAATMNEIDKKKQWLQLHSKGEQSVPGTETTRAVETAPVQANP
jgi:hypothetical protein